MAPVIDALRVDERKEFLTTLGEDLLRQSIFVGDLIVFRIGRMQALAEAYFILNESYKAWRIQPGHYTEEPKIAALTCIAIMKIVPFRPQTLNMAKTVGEVKCNEIFALNCAAAILGVPLTSEAEFKPDFWLRLLDVLSDLKGRSLDAFVRDINNGRQKNIIDYVGNIHEEDKLSINGLITIFELLCNKHVRA